MRGNDNTKTLILIRIEKNGGGAVMAMEQMLANIPNMTVQLNIDQC